MHQCAYFNFDKIMEKYLDYMEKYITKKELDNPVSVMDQFVNLKNDDGLTAVHFAAYKGYYKILDLLEKNGANFYSKTTSK